MIFTAIQAQIALAADMDAIIRKLNTNPAFQKKRSDTQAKLDAAHLTLKRSQSLYDSLYQNYVEQLMTEQEYMTLKARYKAEAEKAEMLIASLEQEQRENRSVTPENRFLREFGSFAGADTLTGEMARALIARVYVDADRHADIRFRYRDEYEAILSHIEGRPAV